MQEPIQCNFYGKEWPGCLCLMMLQKCTFIKFCNFGMTWESVNNDRFFIFSWIILCKLHSVPRNHINVCARRTWSLHLGSLKGLLKWCLIPTVLKDIHFSSSSLTTLHTHTYMLACRLSRMPTAFYQQFKAKAGI